MRLFFEPCGPVVRYSEGTFSVNDLNPEVKAAWRMSRIEMVRFGLRCLISAVWAR